MINEVIVTTSVVFLSKKLYPHCSVLVGSRNGSSEFSQSS